MRDSVALLKDSRFGGPVWSRSVETSKEEEVESILEATPLAVCTGEVEADVVNAKRLGVFVEVSKDRRRFKEVG